MRDNIKVTTDQYLRATVNACTDIIQIFSIFNPLRPGEIWQENTGNNFIFIFLNKMRKIRQLFYLRLFLRFVSMRSLRKGLAPTWRLAIPWTNDDSDIDANMQLMGSMGFKQLLNINQLHDISHIATLLRLMSKRNKC